MLAIENYDVQAVRRETRREMRQEVRQEIQQEIEQERTETERRLKVALKALFDKGSTIGEVASIMNIAEEDITKLLPELALA